MPYLSVNQKWVILITVIALIIGGALLTVYNNEKVIAEATDATDPTDILETTEVTEPVETTEVTEETTEATTEPTTEPTEYVEPVVYIPETEPPTEPTPTNPPETEPETVPPTEAPTEPIPEATDAPVIEETEPVDIPEETEVAAPEYSAEVEMLACLIYQECGGDAYCSDCRRRVADVALNRVNSPAFPNTLYEVLVQEGQYGRFHWTGIVWPERAKYESEAHAVERAYQIAQEVLNGYHSELYGNGYVWQAGFIQGYDNIYCCGHYFGKG